MDSFDLPSLGFAAITTYAMHSTLLLGSAWLLEVSRRVDSPSIRERMWKWAAVAPLITTAAQLSLPDVAPVWEWRVHPEAQSVAWPDTPASDLKMERLSPPEQPSMAAATSADTVAPTAKVALPERRAVWPVQSEPVTPTGGLSVSSRSATVENGADDAGGQPLSAEPWIVSISPGRHEQRATAQLPPAETRPTAGPTLIAGTAPPINKSAGSASTPALAAPAFPTAAAVDADDSSPSVIAVAITSLAGISMGFGLLLAAVRCIRLIGYLQTCRSVNSGLARDALDAVLRSRKIGLPIALLTSQQCGEPSALGVFRWTIIIPDKLESRLSADELTALLSHEVAHLVRRDSVWLWIGQVLKTCLFWQPLNFRAVRCWQEASEYQCDRWAVSDGVKKVTLARVLANVVEWKQRGTISPGLPASAPPLSRRIERLLDASDSDDVWHTGWRRHLLIVTTSSVICFVAIFGPRLTLAKPPAMPVSAKDHTNAPASPSPAADSNDATETQLLHDEMHAVMHDLDLALRLLDESEPDKQIRSHIQGIRQHIHQLQSKFADVMDVQ